LWHKETKQDQNYGTYGLDLRSAGFVLCKKPLMKNGSQSLPFLMLSFSAEPTPSWQKATSAFHLYKKSF
jgi:hypothetical protein